MPRRTATLSPMSASPESPGAFAPHAVTATSGLTSSMLGTPERERGHTHIKRLLQAATATALFGLSGFAFAQTPVCFDSVGRPLPPEQCSQAARDQAVEQSAASGAGSPSLRDECRALADKIANTPDKPVYTRDRRVDSPAGDRVDIPTRTNPRKALKEEYVRKCS
ncbi:MAG: hypothetical protein P4M06_04765 [Pandoraea sp.]|nr:hypothetical protein [Pandoraea sp.]MDR3396854.1 hypothetical protein [Pandoraea sp.]